MLVCVSPALVCGSYLAQVSNQPVVCMRLAEARQPVCVPGVTHQQPHRPRCDHSSQPCADHAQDLTDAGPAEDPTEDTLEERHPGTERVASRGLARVMLVLL